MLKDLKLFYLLLVVLSNCFHEIVCQGYNNIPDLDADYGDTQQTQTFDKYPNSPSFTNDPDLQQKCAAFFPSENPDLRSAQQDQNAGSTTMSNEPILSTEPSQGLENVDLTTSKTSDQNDQTSTLSAQTTAAPGPDGTTLKTPDEATQPTTSIPETSSEATTLPVTDNQEKSGTDSPVTPSRRQGKQLTQPEQLPSTSNDDLIRLIQELTKKIQNLEDTQKILNKNIDDLHNKLENSPQFVQKKEETTNDLVSGAPDQALDKWKDLEESVDNVEQLQNVTNNICNDALNSNAPPTGVMDFVKMLPNKEVKASAYSSVADTISESDEIQEKMDWKEMTPYCQDAAMDTGRDSPTTQKMLNTQNKVRLNAARPIAQSSQSIQREEYQPAVRKWNNIVKDIPDSPKQLETNMKKIMLKTYSGNPINLPFAFQFILVLPPNMGYFKQVAYSCLTQEMKSNGHYYNPNNRQVRSSSNFQYQNHGQSARRY